MSFSLRNKTILGIAVIEASLLIVLVVTAVNFMRSTINDDLVKRASTVATLFATTTKDSVLSYDLASLEAFSLELMKNPDIAYVRVLNDQGQVLAQAGGNQLLARPFSQDSELSNVTDGIFDSHASIVESDHVYGRIELGIDISNIEKSIKKIQNWTSSIALLEMVLVALFSFVLGTYLTHQLKTLRKAARDISTSVSSGEFKHEKVKVVGNDELAEVAQAFNRLITTLEAEHHRRECYQQDLEELNRTLEQKVNKRTAMLNQRNKQLESSNQELHEAQQQLVQAEKMASVGQLAAGVAHEINNPIGFVCSNLSSLEQYIETYRQLSEQVVALLATNDVKLKSDMSEKLLNLIESEDIAFVNDDVGDLLSESSQGLQRVKEIVNGLKQFSRADSDTKQLFDINDCVNTTLNMVSNELKYHCRIEKNLSPLPKTAINVGKISQVLTNLLINAGHAIEKQGVITITTRCENKHIVVKVADDGCGIDSENVDKLFDPFFTTKAEGVGTGLGLSISYGIIQEHGGDISVQSEPGKGSCFSVSLPLDNTNNTDEEIVNG